jgi:hypothetical protein
MMEHIYQQLPFPLTRIIIDYIGLYPKGMMEVVKKTREHLENKYCHRCGEYIVAGKHTTNLKHLSCRQRRYIKKNRNWTRNYHVKIITILQLLYDDMEDENNVIGTGLWCPLVFYSRQPKSYFTLGKTGRWKYCENKAITDVHRNEEFSIIPDMFNNQNNEYYNLFNMSKQESRVIFMQRYKKHTRNDVFRWMFSLKYHKYDNNLGNNLWFAIGRIWEYVQKNTDMKIRVSTMIGLHNIFRYHQEWAKTLLYDYPTILKYIPEKKIKKFFNENQDWFLQYVEDCPRSLKYITLYTQKVEGSELINRVSVS